MLNYEKQSAKYDFPFIFDHQKKLTELWQFSKKKKKVKITIMVAWGGESRFVIFGFFFMLNYGKRSLESDLIFAFALQRKLF